MTLGPAVEDDDQVLAQSAVAVAGALPGTHSRAHARRAWALLLPVGVCQRFHLW